VSITVILDPAGDFERLRRLFEGAGWRLVSVATEPILRGEPEYAVFERNAGESAHYTFNPVCMFRVLEFPNDPDSEMRGMLPVVSSSDIESWLASTDERTLLRGALAARLAPDARFIDPLDSLAKHPRAAIAQAAARARETIRDAMGDTAQPAGGGPAKSTQAEGGDARAAALAFIEVIKMQVRPLLEMLGRDHDGTIAAGLRPREGDYALAFVPEIAGAARTAYETLWAADPARVASIQPGSRLEVYAAPAGMLSFDNELSSHFPGGYGAIAQWLQPQRTWVRWKYVQSGETAGRSYDGLVWLDDHWAWFPKPYRVLAPLSS
jgi:hypothetical protein